MRPFLRLVVCIHIAIAFWLADSLLLSYARAIGFVSALWADAGPGHQMLRLLITVGLLLAGLAGMIRYELRGQEVRRMDRSDRGHLFGEAESPEPGCRLLYHCLRLAELLRMRPREKDSLRLLCYCYDIGLIAIPRRLELPAAALSREEQRLYDQHVDLGAAIAAAIPRLRRAAPLIACHEEHYDGSGAKGMYGRSIPLACRIFQAVRLYDAYTHPADSRRPLTGAEALRELDLYSGGMLDPDVVAAFHRLMDDASLSAKVTAYVYASR